MHTRKMHKLSFESSLLALRVAGEEQVQQMKKGKIRLWRIDYSKICTSISMHSNWNWKHDTWFSKIQLHLHVA